MATLDLPALQKQIAAGKLSPLHLFVGDDVRLVERTVDAVEATIDPADRPFAVDRLYANDPGGSPVDIASSARVLPMLGDRRIVIVHRAERWLKPRRAKAAEGGSDDEAQAAEETGVDLGALEDYISRPADFTTLVFVATEIDRSRRFTRRLLEKAQVTTFAGLGADNAAARAMVRRDVAMQLRQELERAGRTIDQKTLEMLVARAGGDISKLRGDVERLLLYTEGQGRITRSDVEEVASADAGVEDDWGIINAIADGDPARALREAGARLDRGDSPHMLMGQLRWWVSNRLVQVAPDRVKPALDALLRTDLALKSSGGEDRVLIERLVAELTTRASPRPSGHAYGRR